MPPHDRRPERRPSHDRDRDRDRPRHGDRPHHGDRPQHSDGGPPPRPVPVSVSDAQRDDAACWLQGVLTRAGWRVQVSSRKEGSALTFSLSGPDAAQVALDARGLPNRRLVSALKVLLQRKLWPEDAAGPPITIDAPDFARQQDAAFSALARRLAHAASQGARVEVLGMSAADRKLLHHPIGASPDVKSESEGQGIFRHLVIQAR